MKSVNLKYYAVGEGSGYGDAAMQYMSALLDAGVNLSWCPLTYTRLGLAPRHLLKEEHRPPIWGISERQDRVARTINQSFDYQHVLIHAMPELFPKLREDGKHNIGYTVWETDTLPRHWPELLYSVETLLVPCQQNISVFSVDKGPTISCVPHMLAFDPNPAPNQLQLNDAFRARFGINESSYVYLNLGAWCPRKAPEQTLQTYLETFTGDDDVCLMVKTEKHGQLLNSENIVYKQSTRALLDAQLSYYKNPPKVVLIDEFLNEQDLRTFYEIGDCYFSLTHSEGWGLGLYAAAQLGLPIITTGWGGQLDYLPAELAYLVNYTLEPVSDVPGWESYGSYQNWAQADLAHAKALLLKTFKNPSAARLRGEKLKDHVRSNFADQHVITKMLNAIDA